MRDFRARSNFKKQILETRFVHSVAWLLSTALILFLSARPRGRDLLRCLAEAHELCQLVGRELPLERMLTSEGFVSKNRFPGGTHCAAIAARASR